MKYKMVGKIKLHLIRHGEAVTNSISGNDFDRKLSAIGIEEVRRLNSFLFHKNIDFDHCFCSSAQRTKDTSTLVLKNLLTNKIDFRDELYLADRIFLMKFICQTEQCENLLLIGHNEGISDLASYLTGENIYMSTSSYICIQFEVESWQLVSKEQGEIIEIFTP